MLVGPCLKNLCSDRQAPDKLHEMRKRSEALETQSLLYREAKGKEPHSGDTMDERVRGRIGQPRRQRDAETQRLAGRVDACYYKLRQKSNPKHKGQAWLPPMLISEMWSIGKGFAGYCWKQHCAKILACMACMACRPYRAGQNPPILQYVKGCS